MNLFYHKLYEDCGCDDGYVYTHTIENEPYY